MAAFGGEHAVDELSFKKNFDYPCIYEYRFGEIVDPLNFNSEEEFY